ncbi:hypothetical protein LTR85_005008 [Meristemomyces frigidus]|nr:hypothetical protein LTR85_005008 [Meristemomyces frigidus]
MSTFGSFYRGIGYPSTLWTAVGFQQYTRLPPSTPEQGYLSLADLANRRRPFHSASDEEAAGQLSPTSAAADGSDDIFIPTTPSWLRYYRNHQAAEQQQARSNRSAHIIDDVLYSAQSTGPVYHAPEEQQTITRTPRVSLAAYTPDVGDEAFQRYIRSAPPIVVVEPWQRPTRWSSLKKAVRKRYGNLKRRLAGESEEEE